MADINITQLTSYADPKSTDELPIVDLVADVTKRVTLAKLLQNANPGTAAAPGITFDGRAANTGIYSQNDYHIGLATNGVSRVHCRENGYVGINKEAPTAPFDVVGNSVITGTLSVSENLNIASGKVYKINDVEVLSATALAGAVKITSTNITDGTIVNADISANAEIAVSKLADGAARQVLQTDSAGTGVEWTSNLDLPGTLDVTGNVTFDSNLTIAGDLTVNGTTTTINSTTLSVDDKNIELGSVASPTDVTANAGGITLKGATDKTFNWLSATGSWTSSENVDLTSGKTYKINGTDVLSSSGLGSGVTSSSLTSVGTIATGVWQGTAIADTYLETISTSGKVSNSATTATDANTASAIVARDASGNFSAGTITAALTGNASTATALSSARTFALTGDITGTVDSDLTSGASIATSIGTGVIVDANVNTSAAIAGTKISPDFGSQNIATTGNININSGLFNVSSATNAIGFYSATPAVQPSAIADITSTAASGSLPTPDGSVTIADAAAPTVTELLEYCTELEAKLEAALSALRTLGLIAS